MSALQPFSFDVEVDAEAAKQDKITLTVYHSLYSASEEEDLEAFRNYLAAPHGRIFSRRGTGSAIHKTMHVRKRGSASLGKPLFGGKYKMKPVHGSSELEEVRVATELQLFLNPTRFLRYQSATEYVPPRTNFDVPNERLFHPASIDDTEELALDRTDNFLPQNGEYERLHHPALWARAMRSYCEGVLRIVNEDIDEARRLAALTGIQLPAQPYSAKPFSLAKVETYFEFSSADPIGAVAALQPLLESFNELHLTTRDYRTVVSDWQRNSRSITLHIRAGVVLRVYAKTSGRIRFEVEHDFKEARFRSVASERGSKAQQTFTSMTGVYSLIERMREDAATIVNDVLAHCRGRKSIPASDKTAVDLLFDIAGAVGSRQNAKTIIDVLIHKGSISSLPNLSAALTKLKRKRILQTQPRNSRQEYVVTPDYKFALQTLQEHGSFAHLTVRKRTRNAGA